MTRDGKTPNQEARADLAAQVHIFFDDIHDLRINPCRLFPLQGKVIAIMICKTAWTLLQLHLEIL